jgi:hypothetical protein
MWRLRNSRNLLRDFTVLHLHIHDRQNLKSRTVLSCVSSAVTVHSTRKSQVKCPLYRARIFLLSCSPLPPPPPVLFTFSARCIVMWACKSSSLRTLYEYIPLLPDAQIGNHMLPPPIYIAANNGSTFPLHKAHDLNSTYFLADLRNQ